MRSNAPPRVTSKASHAGPAGFRLLAAIVVLAGSIAWGHVLADADPIDAQVDALFTSFTTGLQPGAAVMVIRQGRIVHARGYGHANLAKQVPITVDSAFRLASVSKQFTAMAIALLADRGQLGLDDPVAKFVPVLSVYPGVTIHHLLAHTSGLPDYYDEFDTSAWEARGDLPGNAEVMIYLAGMGEALFAPGQKYEYSNPGYEALALVVEAVSGKGFASFMQSEIFTPLGMQHSLIHDHTRPDIADRVTGYSMVDGRYELNDDDPLNGVTGSGGQYSSLRDFYAWDQALYDDTLVSEPMRQQVFGRAVLNSGEEIDYGFGWRLDTYRGQQRIAHGGSWVGFRTAISRYPALQLTVVVLSNRAEYDPGAAADRVADIFLDQPVAAD